MKYFFIFLFFQLGLFLGAQSPWPASNWDTATDLTFIMSTAGVEGLSGVHYNATKNQLFVVQDIGRFRVIQLNNQTGNHLQLTNRTLGGDLEGIMQINDTDNEFWVINEDDYRIERYAYNNNFSQVNLQRSWNLLLPISGMQVTNGGPEGICFVPDSFLVASGFVSSVSGEPYTSQKGMNGLVFVAHQHLGQVWVFDINKNTNDDYALVGVYNTSRQESCGLSFDRSTGLLYILHNIDNNYLEVCDLAVIFSGGVYQLNQIEEFSVPLPTTGNKNIEGVAITPKCDFFDNQKLWLVRDILGSNSVAALREFSPFGLLGGCPSVNLNEFESSNLAIYPNPTSGIVHVYVHDDDITSGTLLNLFGQEISRFDLQSGLNIIVFNDLHSGIYFIKRGNEIHRLIIN